MLADGIEAAARTLQEPTHDRIQGLVQKLINKIFSSGELNECELTLKDLHLIAKCFTRILTGIYHQRVAYAEPAEKVREKEEDEETEEKEEQPIKKRVNVDEPAAKNGKKGKNGKSDGRSDKKTDKEGLKRLGM